MSLWSSEYGDVVVQHPGVPVPVVMVVGRDAVEVSLELLLLEAAAAQETLGPGLHRAAQVIGADLLVAQEVDLAQPDPLPFVHREGQVHAIVAGIGGDPGLDFGQRVPLLAIGGQDLPSIPLHCGRIVDLPFPQLEAVSQLLGAEVLVPLEADGADPGALGHPHDEVDASVFSRLAQDLDILEQTQPVEGLDPLAHEGGDVAVAGGQRKRERTRLDSTVFVPSTADRGDALPLRGGRSGEKDRGSRVDTAASLAARSAGRGKPGRRGPVVQLSHRAANLHGSTGAPRSASPPARRPS